MKPFRISTRRPRRTASRSSHSARPRVARRLRLIGAFHMQCFSRRIRSLLGSEKVGLCVSSDVSLARREKNEDIRPRATARSASPSATGTRGDACGRPLSSLRPIKYEFSFRIRFASSPACVPTSSAVTWLPRSFSICLLQSGRLTTNCSRAETKSSGCRQSRSLSHLATRLLGVQR